MSANVMHIEPFFDAATGTVSYVLADTISGQAAVIDPVLDFEPKSGTLSSRSADKLIDYVRANGWQLQWILETHAHADHLSAAQHIRHHLGGKVAIGAHIRDVQAVFRKIYHFERSLPDGSQFDHLVQDGERLPLGQLELLAMHVPGHTPADMAYRVEDAVFVGDTLFMPDVGTARADFPGGDAATLYRSIRRILALPEQTRILSATTTRRLGASRNGRPRYRPSATATSMCMMASARRSLCRCALHATPRWICPR
jgi:glyoxylase-like metal-dependent hydrolase (beta-lactamase superfamily II)